MLGITHGVAVNGQAEGVVEHAGLDPARLLARCGVVIAAAFQNVELKPLAAHGYDGWLVVEAEQDPAKAHPLTYATKGYRSLLATAKEAGFTVRTRDG